ncbi:MAG: SWIM zinc finger family protein [Pyrobaculum sp.]
MRRFQIDEEIKSFLLSLSRTLGVRIEKILDLYLYVTPETVEIIEVVERSGEVIGVRLAVRSKKRQDLWHYVAVGRRGGKCTCRGNAVGGKICRHITIGLITWHIISLLKTGKGVDVSTLQWLRDGVNV